MEIKEKLVVLFHSAHLNEDFDCLVNYERDIEINEPYSWNAVGIESTPEEPIISIWGILDEKNHPLAELLTVQIDHNDHTTEIIRDIKVLECE